MIIIFLHTKNFHFRYLKVKEYKSYLSYLHVILGFFSVKINMFLIIFTIIYIIYTVVDKCKGLDVTLKLITLLYISKQFFSKLLKILQNNTVGIR